MNQRTTGLDTEPLFHRFARRLTADGDSKKFYAITATLKAALRADVVDTETAAA